MSSASVTSSKREASHPYRVEGTTQDIYQMQIVTSEMAQEIDSIRAMNSSLQAYLDHLRAFKKNLIFMNDNCKQLNKVNKQWIETLSNMK